MNCQLSVPAKTFILGEYLVLQGGPAIVLTSNPPFILHVYDAKDPKTGSFEGIHEKSPAGLFIDRNKPFFDGFSLEFIDPWHGMGGLGASSAQFALVYALKAGLKRLNAEDLPQILDEYLHCAWNGEGIAPSGADVIAQLNGGLCLYHPEKQLVMNLNWPFPSLDYCLIHTNNKVATHEHLKNLQNLNTAGLEAMVENALIALESKNAKLFAESIREFWAILEKNQLVAKETLALVNQINAQQGVLVSKGCGALGADIIFVLLDSDCTASFGNWCAENNVKIIGSGQNFGEGLKIA